MYQSYNISLINFLGTFDTLSTLLSYNETIKRGEKKLYVDSEDDNNFIIT